MSNLHPKDTKWTILEIGNVEISSLKKEISKYSHEWDIDTTRQDNNITHKNTKMYQLRYCSYDWIPGSDLGLKNVNSLKTESAKKELDRICDFLESFYNAKVVRIEIVKMMPNVKIRKHVDGGQFLTYARRCHIPINTNDQVFFTVLNNTINMKEGACYEINNSLPHSVENNSNEERDHIILDILPVEMLQ